MARFDVFAAEQAGNYLLDCQSDTLRHFGTRFVVPLMVAEATRQADRLHPIFDVDGQRLVMVTHLASAVPIRLLQKQVANLGEYQFTITGAIDMLTGGV